jgi:ABC-type uncharacterized transport system permease subunit
VALMLAGFAGFTLAAGLAAFYLWHERRLKRREARILRLNVPPLDALERLSARTAAVSLAVLSAGIALGLAGLAQEDGARFDRTMAVTLAAWAIFVAVLGMRALAGLHGRRAARAMLAGFVLVLLALPLTHFA